MTSNIWSKIGKVCYIVCLPLLAIYLRIGKRTRVVVVTGSKVLVVRGWLGDDKWSMPGGGLHRNELPVDGAKRELLEETGIDLPAKKLNQLGSLNQQTKGIISYKYYVFSIEVPKTLKITKQKSEIVDAAWIEINSLNVTNADTDVLQAIQAWKGEFASDTM